MVMKSIAACFLILSLAVSPTQAMDFGLAENSLSEFRAIKYENMYTKVPTTGKLVSIKITDSGKAFYICREKTGYVIYNLEIRPMPGLREKIEQELKDTGKKWDGMHPDDLLLTREKLDYDMKRRIHKYSEAVWIRNEIVIEEPRKPATQSE
jgi:hypothetical protein